MVNMKTFLLGLGFSGYETEKLTETYGESDILIDMLSSPEGRKKLSSVVESQSVETAHIQFCRIWSGTDVFSSLEPFGVPTESIYRFFLQCGEDEKESIRLLNENIYRLVFDVYAPFPSVDEASALFDSCDESARCEAAVYAALLLAERGTEELTTGRLGKVVGSVAGSTCLPVGTLLEIAGLLLGDDSSAAEIMDAAKRLHFRKNILLTRKTLNGNEALVAMRSETAGYELSSAKLIGELLSGGPVEYGRNPYEAIDAAQQTLGLYLSHEQVDAVYRSLTNRISVITGGPGTGKTQTQKVLLESFRRLSGGSRVQLMAPTGQAAKNMEKATGESASTIHSALGIFPGETDSRKAFDLTAGLVIVDEASMVDAQLFSMLLEHIGSAILVIVGDVDQLPSIGAGNVLAELIECVPVTRLTKIFRQDKDSSDIAYNAARIKAGSTKMIESDRFSFIGAPGSSEIQRAVCEVYAREVKRVGTENVAVLTPLRRKTGVNQLNKALRKTCSDSRHYVSYGDVRIYLNDKVIFLKNRYGLSNGSTGFVTKVGRDSAECTFGEKKITLSGSQLSWIVPAYAETIHKSQGDEHEVVIVVADKNHSAPRSMLYTACTRSKNKLIVVGEWEAFEQACGETGGQRYSLLSSLVKEGQA